MISTEQGALTAVTEVARIDLSCGSFDALSASHFSSRFPPHFHDTFAIGVVETGAARLHTRRGEWIARAGTILAFSPGEVHSAEPLTPDGYTYRMVYPPLEILRDLGIYMSPEPAAPLFRIPVIEDPVLGHEFRCAHVPLMDGATGPEPEQRLVNGLRNLVAQYADPRGQTECSQADVEVVERARGYLRDRFSQPIRLACVAEVCGLSPFHLIRVFRRVVGVSPYSYLVQLRVNRARVLLCQGSSVADAAYTCGFSDQSHLTRMFKKVLGVPPGKYVRSVRRSAA